MANPFLGEIRMFAGNFAPLGWMLCDGSLQPIATNAALFNLIGTQYGGDGQVTFALPDLRGRIPIHLGNDTASGASYTLAESAGTETVTLTVAQLPQHTHQMAGSSGQAVSASPAGNVYASGDAVYSTATPSIALNAASIAQTGGSQPHSNFMPYLCVNFIIATSGIYPS